MITDQAEKLDQYERMVSARRDMLAARDKRDAAKAVSKAADAAYKKLEALYNKTVDDALADLPLFDAPAQVTATPEPDPRANHYERTHRETLAKFEEHAPDPRAQPAGLVAGDQPGAAMGCQANRLPTATGFAPAIEQLAQVASLEEMLEAESDADADEIDDERSTAERLLMADPAVNDNGVYERYETIKIPMPKSWKCGAEICVAEGNDSRWRSSCHYTHPTGNGGGLPNVRDRGHATRAGAIAEQLDYMARRFEANPKTKKAAELVRNFTPPAVPAIDPPAEPEIPAAHPWKAGDLVNVNKLIAGSWGRAARVNSSRPLVDGRIPIMVDMGDAAPSNQSAAVENLSPLRPETLLSPRFKACLKADDVRAQQADIDVALRHSAGEARLWDAHREIGATEGQIRDTLPYGTGQVVTRTIEHAGRELSYSYRGGRKPALWVGWHRGKSTGQNPTPTFSGSRLYQEVRRVLAIPEAKPNTPTRDHKARPKGPASHTKTARRAAAQA